MLKLLGFSVLAITAVGVAWAWHRSDSDLEMAFGYYVDEEGDCFEEYPVLRHDGTPCTFRIWAGQERYVG